MTPAPKTLLSTYTTLIRQLLSEYLCTRMWMVVVGAHLLWGTLKAYEFRETDYKEYEPPL